jgi:phage gp29-like protein
MAIFERASVWLRGFFEPKPSAQVEQQAGIPALPPGRPVGEAPSPEAAPLAPFPLVDRYPTVLGSSLTFQTISSLMRLCTTGYRREYVDLLDELLEREPHGFAVLAKRILVVAGARLEITHADIPEDDARFERAKEIAEFVNECIEGIADLEQSLAALQWAVYYGVAAAEIGWTREGTNWVPKRLHFIHSRRVAYPDPGSWKAHIWDQGSVRSFWDASSPTANVGSFGIVVDDFPGKFILHTPQLRGNYPTRDGLGRELAFFFALKGMTLRGAGQYVEKFGKPWPVLEYATTNTATPRMATSEDLAAANNTAAAFGSGAAASAVLPNSVKATLVGPGLTGRPAITHTDLLEYIDGQISKCVEGSTLTTDAGNRGNAGATKIHKQGATELARYDANCLSETLRRDLIAWIVRLNFPDEVDLTPRVQIHVDEKPDPAERMDLAASAAAVGMPIDADELGQELGLPLIKQEPPEDAEPGWKAKPRRLVPIKPVEVPADILGGDIKPPPPPPPPAPVIHQHGPGPEPPPANDSADSNEAGAEDDLAAE